MRPVYLKWVDSASLFGDAWAKPDDLTQHEDETYCETLGYVAKENDHSVYVASSIAPEEIGSVLQIPKVAIIERRDVHISAVLL